MAQAPSAAERAFTDKVLPVLRAKCFGCHGDDPAKVRGGLDLRTRQSQLAGGDSGQAALAPGHPEKSLLYVAATRRDADLVMPPKEADQLSAEQLRWLKQWIEAGAPWPDTVAKKGGWDDVKNGVTVKTSGGRSADWTNRKYRPEDIWALQPIRKPAVPRIANPLGPIHNPIDAFIQEKLIAKGINAAVAPADARTLLRRMTFDLTGLPPTAEELDALRDDANAKPQAVIDRLLASPRYGEQMARHWLDVVRYADTSGFSNDFERPHAWRYRDYVIRSFNADKPFDRFIIEQIAGDELAKPRDERSESRGSDELRVAAGFLRMGPWEHTGMSVAAVTRQDFLDDVTHHVGVTFLGVGLRCARCHDHKFDPIPTLDYYRMQAVFAPVQFAETPLPFLPGETNVDDGTKPLIEGRLASAQAEFQKYSAKGKAALAAWLKARGYKTLKEVPDAERPNQVKFGLTDEELTLLKMWRKRAEFYERERLRYEAYAFTVYNGPLRTDYVSNKPLNGMPGDRVGPVQPVHVLTGGALETPAEETTPGFLSALAGGNVAPKDLHGRRLALAQWIASPDNPLTARVIVNRVWQWHFGRGLVATPNNFGKMGARATHPELLDWLASWFVENGWSIKKLHRLIMTSATYQQESGVRGQESGKAEGVDPENRLLWKFPARRLAAEEIRDAMLAVSGELNLRAGGPGAFPEINWEVALQPRHVMGSPAPVYQPSPQPEQRNRRTIYTFRFRTLADPLLEVFNRPGSDTSCECRDQTTVVSQSLALFNSEYAHNRALALAKRLNDGGGSLDDKIARGFQLCYGRQPTAPEMGLCRDHVARQLVHHRRHAPLKSELPRVVRRKVIQEETGLEIAWDEPLDVMRNYRRDLMPWEVGAETRALADLCLVLLNSNEFLYVR
jgi:mono/diheme cytochrome c family protein